MNQPGSEQTIQRVVCRSHHYHRSLEGETMRIQQAFSNFRYKLFPLALALLALLIPASVNAQSQATTGVIEGIVVDQGGAVVVGATVTVKNKDTGFERTVTTDDNG